ncbi:hypothetical protein AB0A60_29380 [Streptomyces sp. NPDC046275]|uniref:hypothetical protein n=1 Tax=Streptomyces sp. NPDC046275 TaxID=3157201 RepID=UPI0033E0168D
MSGNAPVDPAEIPVFTGNLEVLDQKVKALSSDGPKIVAAAGDVHTTFGGLRAFYQAPEAEQLFAVTQPVKDKALELSSDLCVIAGALGTYAQEVRPLKTRLENLRREAAAFRAKVADDDKWREDGDLIEENLGRRNEVAEVWAAFQEAERACHAKIVALVGGTPLKVNDGSNQAGMYGYDAESLKASKSLPWGDAVAESTPWWQVWEHAYDFGKGVIVDGAWETIKGLGVLVGFQGWDAAGQAWTGLAKLATGSLITSIPGANVAFWTADDEDLPGWLRDSRTAMKETGKALLAWDQWGENPSRAAGAVTFNVLTTVFTGGAGGAASGAGKAGAAARALSVAGKVSRAIDPATYVFKGAGAGLSKIGDVMAGLKGMGKIEIPAMPAGAITLPEGAFKLPDGTLHLPTGSAVPKGAFEIPAGTVKLPDGVPVPAGAVDFGDGMVKLPEGTQAPAGSLPVPEGTVKVPEGATALPPGTTKVTDFEGATRYFDSQGNLLKEDGTLQQHHSAAVRETSPAAAANPQTDGRVLAGVGAHAGEDAGRAGYGRVVGDTPAHPSAGGSAPPVGAAADHSSTNGVVDHTPTRHSGGGGNTPTGGSFTTSGSGRGVPDGAAGGASVPHAGDLAGRGRTDLGPGGAGGESGPVADDSLADAGTEATRGEDAADGHEAVDDAAARHGEDNPYVGHEPDFSRSALTPGEGPLTLRDVRNIRSSRVRWQQGEELHRQMWGGAPERHYPVPMRSEGRYPVTTPGGRKVDVPVDMPDGRTVAVEVKTYGEYRTITLKDGSKGAVKNEVPLSQGIKEQIHKDLALREMNPRYDPRWSFTHAGPSKELRGYLTEVKIIFLEYGPAPKKN